MASKKENETQLPTVYDYGNHAGRGYEGTSGDDYAIPFLSLLQQMSPECGQSEGAIEGAKAGMFLNSVTKELYDGKKGIIFVPCATQHVFIEWRPREAGGGIVGRHGVESPIVAKARSAAVNYGSYKTDNGNDLIETFYMFGYMLENSEDTVPGSMIVIPFTSTKIKKYRQVMQTLRTFRGRPPLFANRLRITSVLEKNNKGNFFNVELRPLNGGVGESLIPPMISGAQNPLLLAGETLMEQVVQGTATISGETSHEDRTQQIPF